jgi:hypothetical protein
LHRMRKSVMKIRVSIPGRAGGSPVGLGEIWTQEHLMSAINEIEKNWLC